MDDLFGGTSGPPRLVDVSGLLELPLVEGVEADELGSLRGDGLLCSHIFIYIMKNDKNNVPGASSHPSAVAERPSLLLFLLVPVPLVVGHVYANRLRQLLELVVRVVHHPVLYILPQRIEYLLYLVVLLRTHLQVLQTVLLRQPLPLFGRYLANSILLQVYFVRD